MKTLLLSVLTNINLFWNVHQKYKQMKILEGVPMLMVSYFSNLHQKYRQMKMLEGVPMLIVSYFSNVHQKISAHENVARCSNCTVIKLII